MHRLLPCVFSIVLSGIVATSAAAREPDALQAVFRIEPVRPVSELLPLALAAKPPLESNSGAAIWSSW